MENLNINYDKTVSNATVSMISAGAILVISVLIVLLVLVIKRWKGKIYTFGIRCSFVCCIWVYVFTAFDECSFAYT